MWLAALAAAEGAVLLFTPRDDVLAPRPVDVTGYFSRAILDRAQDYRDGQLLLSLARLALEAALLVVLVRRPPTRLLRGGRRRPVAVAALAGAGLSAALTLVTLPVSAYARSRSVDVGLATQSWGGWAADVLRQLAIGAALAAVGAALAIALIRRAPRFWWLPGSALVVACGALFVSAGPVVLDPIANDFTPLRGQARADVLELARRADVQVGEVLVVDASRRTTAANAYVSGLGRTKRVVVYDTLLRDFTRAEQRLVLAHELGHVRHRDVPRGLLYLLLVAPFGTLAVARLTDAFARAGGAESGARAGAATLPAVVLALALVALPMTWVSNQLSRSVEARADAFALRLTGDPAAFIAFERRIARQNVSDPDPPAITQLLFGTHPTTRERIGAAEAFSRRTPP